MGFIGKLLVLLYGAAAIMCLIGATAVYTQQMGFVTPKGEDPKKFQNRVEKSIAKTKDYIKANDRAYTRWQQEYEKVVKKEIEEYNRREFYRGQIELIVTGKLNGQAVQEPIQVLDIDKNNPEGLLDISKPTGRKSEIDGLKQSARPLYAYKADIAQINSQMILTQDDTQKKIQAYRDATVVMNGRENPFEKGYRVRIKEQEAIAIDATVETVYLEDFVTNRRAEAQLFIKRRDSLQARVEELKKHLREKAGGQGN